MQKYFISEEEFNLNQIRSDDAFHIANVMRCRVNDNVLIGYNNKTYLVKLTNITNKMVTFEIVKEETGVHELPVFVTIFQGYPKGDKLDDIIKHSTELGVYEIIPTIMKRSIFKLDTKKLESKLIRFNKIAKEAAEQSFRDYVPNIPSIKYLKEIDFSNFDKKILCYEESAKNNELVNFKNIISSLNKNDKVAILIGPEGGIDDSELTYLKDKGFVECSLGPRILRTETASFYCLSSISYELELKK